MKDPAICLFATSVRFFSMAKWREMSVVALSLVVFDSPSCHVIATEAWNGRHVIVSVDTDGRNPVFLKLLEDGYSGWISPFQWRSLEPVSEQEAFHPELILRPEIENRLRKVVAFTTAAKEVPNCYKWGGTAGPNYDCSGLIQRAFASEGIWIPRDAYQQEAFLSKVSLEIAAPGDLVFFGSGLKATHVGLCVAINSNANSEATSAINDCLSPSEAVECQQTQTNSNTSPESDPPAKCTVIYVHSSGIEHGHNGIQFDLLSDSAGQVAAYYFREFRGVGRILRSYVSEGTEAEIE